MNDQMNPTSFKAGDICTLEENDCFGTTCTVEVLKVHEGGNVIVRELFTNKEREVGAANLSWPTPKQPDQTKPSPDVTPLTKEEVLTLKVAHLVLDRGMVETAALVLNAGARKVSAAQVLVLRADLEELMRRVEDAKKTQIYP